MILYICVQQGGQLASILQRINAACYVSAAAQEPDGGSTRFAQLLQKMSNGHQVAWEPEYGAAAMKYDLPLPVDLSQIQVLGLDGWQKHDHR